MMLSDVCCVHRA